MFKANIGVSQWVSLPFETRQRLVELFGLNRSGGSLVEDGRLKTDGYTEKDLSEISMERMQKLLNSDSENFYDLFDKVLTFVEEQRTAEVNKQKEAKAHKSEEAQRIATETAMQTLAEVTAVIKPVIKKRKNV